MATITIEYDDGTIAHWIDTDAFVEEFVEPVLGSPDGIKT